MNRGNLRGKIDECLGVRKCYSNTQGSPKGRQPASMSGRADFCKLLRASELKFP